MMRTYFHGGAQVYERLTPGTGIDGDGIYLTTSRNRAEMYGKRSASGRDRKAFLTEVGVDTALARVWDDEAKVDLRGFAAPGDAHWIADLQAQHGPQVTIMTGQNARVYLGWLNDRSNDELKRRGFQAIKRGSDLVVLDPSIIEYSVKLA
jgi:hypothetical protein